MSFQFVHMELYSRKGRDGRDVDFVLGEAARRPDASLHVSDPRPPQVVYGAELDALRDLHDSRAASAKVTLASGKQRAVRKDQNTLLTVVASHPATIESCQSDAETRIAVERWEALTVHWLRQQFGAQLVSVVRHIDEAHPHLHAFVLPGDVEMRAARLHPGQAAKGEVMAAGPDEGEDGKSLNARGDMAYKAAMREWQDSYWQAAGMPSGLTRLGPGRRRLSRAAWHAEQAQARAVVAAQTRVESLQVQAALHVQEARSVAAAELVKARREASRMVAAAVASRAEATRLHAAAAARVRTASDLISRARREAQRILRVASAEGQRLRSLGSRIRSLWDGLRRSSIENRVRTSFQPLLAQERQRAAAAERQAADEASRRRAAERARDEASRSAIQLGAERDAARRRLGAMEHARGAEMSINQGRQP